MKGADSGHGTSASASSAHIIASSFTTTSSARGDDVSGDGGTTPAQRASRSWMVDLCGSPICSMQVADSCAWEELFDSSTCMNHIMVTGVAALISIILAIQLLVRIPRSGASARQLVARGSPLQLAGVVFNGCLGLIYIGLGLWMLWSNFSQDASVHLPHWWLVALSQGFSLILISIAFSIRAQFLGMTYVRIWSVLLTIYAAFVCCSSVANMIADKDVTMKGCLDVLFLPGALLLLLYGIWSIREDVGLAMIASLVVIILTVLCNAPLAKLQHKFQSKLMEAQDVRLKAMTESLIHMKVLKLYAWEAHFKKVIERLREVEYKWLSAFQLRKSYNSFLFWSSPVLVSAATFLACYLLKIPLDASNVFTFVATLRLVQDPIRQIPDVIGVVIQAKVAFTRITKFLDAPELNGQVRKKYCVGSEFHIVIDNGSFSWDENPSKPTLNNINLVVKAGEKVAICGEVGSGKSTLLAAVLGEVPKTEGTIQVCGKMAYVSQNAWIQTGTVQDNILFGSSMDKQRYQETLERCSLVKDLEMLPYGDRTQIGERGVNLSGGQKQRVQLARALYKNADIYLLDDPFSAVDAHTATSLFNEYVMEALSDKTVLLVTHQVDFLPVFDSILVSADLSIVDLDVPFTFMFSIGTSINSYSNLGKFYLASAKELMRINGTTKSAVANHLGESIAGAITIRAFEEEDRFFEKNLELVDKNAGPYFYNFAATEWLIQRLETMSAAVLSFSAFVMALLPPGTFNPGFIGMALSYGLSLNMSFVFSIQNQCQLTNQIISVERVSQYIDIPSEAAEIIEENRPSSEWPQTGRVELRDLKIRYRQDAPLVLHGITCTFEGGDKIGIVGRTGSGKTTLIGALFRLVEPAGGKIIIDSVDITTIGLHDLRSRLGIIPQDPTLFQGTIRYNLDPLGQFSDQQIWEVTFVEDGSNWSMGQRQLFCLGRALLRRCRVLVLDEATASIDNATDAILQKTIRTEFRDCTVVTVAHRIPTVMDCSMVLAMSDGKVVEYDRPLKLMETEGSLFRDLVKEYWSYTSNGNI
nr:unnamed protein product [Digitaria exilis]